MPPTKNLQNINFSYCNLVLKWITSVNTYCSLLLTPYDKMVTGIRTIHSRIVSNNSFVTLSGSHCGVQQAMAWCFTTILTTNYVFLSFWMSDLKVFLSISLPQNLNTNNISCTSCFHTVVPGLWINFKKNSSQWHTFIWKMYHTNTMVKTSILLYIFYAAYHNKWQGTCLGMNFLKK